MRFCHIVPSLADRHGGPSKSVRALANAQASIGEAVDLLTSIEPGTDIPSPEGNLALIRTFPRIAPRWLCRAPALNRHLAASAYDCVHNHALWLLTLHYAHIATQSKRVPLVISPRGMLSGWAYTHRRWRKRLAELFVHPGAFRDAAGWHATSPEEADDIRALGFRQPVCVAPNGIDPPTDTQCAEARREWLARAPQLGARRVALFYSRFHRKKRLRELIDLWLSAPRGDWLLLLVGLPEEYSVAEIQGWIDAAAGRDRILVFDGTAAPPPYAIASLFLLPSHSENFGMVVAEALAGGVPALVTDTTPWRPLEAAGAGWCVPWTSYAVTLQTALATPPAELAAHGTHGRRWVIENYSWEKSALLLLNFYHHLADVRR
ncbi:MAG: glycosyltransferase [Opitutaceae bacterium]|nr:glycosyltransferase [Opitutaceae bacterium]